MHLQQTKRASRATGGSPSYASIPPIDHPIAAQRQKAKRHYGVHPYFTRRPFNVLREYISGAAESGAELKTAVAQVGDPIWSMHKKKNGESVLAGEMILTFCKTGARRRYEKRNGFDLAATIHGILSDANSNRVYGEYLFNRVVIDAWNKGAIDTLTISKNEFTQLIESFGWHYDPQRHYWAKENKAQDSLFENL